MVPPLQRTKIVEWGFFILSFLYLSGCGSLSQFSPGKGAKYVYSFKMTYPIESEEMLFQDDSIVIQFKFDEAALRFQLQNIAESDIRIAWDKASLSINGQYFSVRHADNLYTDTSLVAYSALIPSMGYIRDLAIPKNNIYFDGEQWIELDLLPTVDYNNPNLRTDIVQSVGKPLTFLLPLEFNGVSKNYEFEFQVKEVRQIPWKEYVPTQRVPAPPMVPKKVSTVDKITAAVVTVGLLGFSAYVLTMKKSPPTE
ncbi:MAG: hypothetical protein N3A63_09065 [Bacteroidetes bacterium]|nr:hypothetical protein [Bacteroidota bacterium]